MIQPGLRHYDDSEEQIQPRHDDNVPVVLAALWLLLVDLSVDVQYGAVANDAQYINEYYYA